MKYDIILANNFAGQSKNHAKKSLEKILRIRQELDKKSKELVQLEGRRLSLLDTNPLDPTLDELDVALIDLQAHRDHLLTSFSKQSQALGISEQQSLKRLMTNEYLCLLVNMRAKKQRIRERIRRRKFELARIERSHRHSVNGRLYFTHSQIYQV